MRLKLPFLWIVLVGFLSSTAIAKSTPSVAPITSPGTVQTNKLQRGTLYRVHYQGNTAYLFGTIHVGKEGVSPLEGEAKKALVHSAKLVLEVDIDQGSAIQDAIKKYSMYGEGDSVDKHLSPQTLTQLQTMLASSGIAFGSVSQMKPWAIGNLLLIFDLMKSGFSPDKGADVTLLAYAKAHAKTFEALETAEYQMSLFDSMSDIQQEQSLSETLIELANGTAADQGSRLMNAWTNGDGVALDGLLREMTENKTVSAEFLKRVFLDRRNAEMAEKLESIIKKNKSIFVGVGWLHLVGEDGIPRRLQRHGFEVKKIY